MSAAHCRTMQSIIKVVVFAMLGVAGTMTCGVSCDNSDGPRQADSLLQRIDVASDTNTNADIVSRMLVNSVDKSNKSMDALLDSVIMDMIKLEKRIFQKEKRFGLPNISQENHGAHQG